MTAAERYAETDAISAWAQANRFAAIACGLPEVRPPASVVPRHILVASPKAMALEPAEHQSGDDFQSATLKLGEAEVDVEYVILGGSVLVQGCTVNDEWVDVDCFSASVNRRWVSDIERMLGAE